LSIAAVDEGQTAAPVYFVLPFEASVGAIPVGRTGDQYFAAYRSAGLRFYDSRDSHGSGRAAIDFALPADAWVTASAPGKVVSVVKNCEVYIQHADGSVTQYRHIKRISVSKNDTVTYGTRLGQVGRLSETCGPSGGAHLHFERQKSLFGAEIPIYFVDVPAQTVAARDGTRYTCPAGLVCPRVESRSPYVAFRYSVTPWYRAMRLSAVGLGRNMCANMTLNIPQNQCSR
jgi:hypothetical protein